MSKPMQYTTGGDDREMAREVARQIEREVERGTRPGHGPAGDPDRLRRNDPPTPGRKSR